MRSEPPRKPEVESSWTCVDGDRPFAGSAHFDHDTRPICFSWRCSDQIALLTDPNQSSPPALMSKRPMPAPSLPPTLRLSG